MPAPRPILIRGATVLADTPDGRRPVPADLLVENGLVAAIGPGLRAGPEAEVVEAGGHLVAPGLINAHFHSPGNFMKGMLDGLPLELFMLYEVPPLAEGAASGRLAYVRTMLGALEMLKLGVTSVMDDAFHVPVATPESVDGIMEAYRDAGIRARVAIDQPNVVEYEKFPFLADLLPASFRREMDAAPRQSAGELLDLYDHLIGRWHGAEDGRLAAALSCSAPQRVTVPYLHALARLSRERHLPFNVHILETKVQRVLGDEKYGRSLVRYARDEGALSPDTVVIHAIWVDDADMAILADTGVTVAHNPVCNLRLGSGIAPFRAWRRAGIHVCLGTDELIADDGANLWAAAKTAGLVHTLADPDPATWPTAGEVLDTLWDGGARALGLQGRIGRLAPGALADLMLIDLDTLAFTPLNDLERQLVYCETGSSVRHVMVGGRWVVRDGRVLTVDEAALRREAREIMRIAEPDMAAARAAARRLEPYYAEMVRRAHARDVGLRRRLD
ncbi:amidohydrolase family protein [Prosthecomicrobium sp. N25]|uniref:amidohydrolase family protein n=1 Tax=Prosthecomicrobium sp. N25 TaxID=3129254 RepID=UPI0030778EE1